MNKNYVYLITTCILIISASFIFNIFSTKEVTDLDSSKNSYTKSIDNKKSYKAKFQIITLGTRRTFDNSMYQNLSNRAYITSNDPESIIVDDNSITWGEFFQTLPFKITEDCLITGTGQTFCSTEKNKLKFILNNNERPDALDQKIKENDYLLIQYGEG